MIKKQKEGKKGKIKVDRMKKGTEIVGSHDQRVEPLETRRPKERERGEKKKEKKPACANANGMEKGVGPSRIKDKKEMKTKACVVSYVT